MTSTSPESPVFHRSQTNLLHIGSYSTEANGTIKSHQKGSIKNDCYISSCVTKVSVKNFVGLSQKLVVHFYNHILKTCLFCFGATTNGVPLLLLGLGSEITPHRFWGWHGTPRIKLGCPCSSKCPTLCAIPLAPLKTYLKKIYLKQCQPKY